MLKIILFLQIYAEIFCSSKPVYKGTELYVNMHFRILHNFFENWDFFNFYECLVRASSRSRMFGEMKSSHQMCSSTKTPAKWYVRTVKTRIRITAQSTSQS